ncbi:peroxisomal sarcosine oxidase-like [Mizuhopecten yessoensis]|uniref:peroxisomal sarcosine oxidase-like n=1 Tax=Mizuhopecten yessoensis TaxID=6573 RepID=UPI000B45AE1B|nr:peroxisomal sarcosine oxidase-like [Mizuhopecten yessoensis]
MKVYDSIVVGAGIEGSSTAYNLVKNGQRTLLLEQFPLPHSRGSSHGQSRIFRMAYGDADYYTEMMKEAYRLWEKLENESRTTIYTKTGLLVLGKAGDELIDGTVQALRKHSVPFTTLNGKAMRLKYPMLAYSDDVSGVDDHSGGVLFADKALAAFQGEFMKHGGVLRDKESLVDVFPGDIVTVKTNKGSYRGRNLVLAVGPWATKILPPLGIHLPLKVLRISVFYWKEKIAGTYGADEFPTFLGGYASGNFDVYGLPSLEYPGLYKNTPDHDFVLDRHPARRNIIIGAGFSGHGFKLSPVVGIVLAELVMRKTLFYNLSHFRIDRFNKSSKL